MTQPTKYTGTASISVLNNADLPPNTWISVRIPPSIHVDWHGNAPQGRSDDTLFATFTQGYEVSYTVQYVLGGTIYIDSGSAQFVEQTVDARTGEIQPVNTLNPTKGAGLWYYWQFGTANGSPPYTVPVGVLPGAIRYSVQRSGVKYAPYGMTWHIYYTINVALSCTPANITTQICRDICLGSLSESCHIAYDNYCLAGDPKLLATDTCKDFYTKWIAVNGSDEGIDRQARAYCSAKYRGFQDLFEGRPGIPEADRLRDIQICSCNLVAEPGPDPEGTVLYQNFFNSLAAQFPGFGVFGASIQQKCLVPACASSAFKPAGVGPGGCKVPQCISLASVTVENGGTINGNVTIDSSTSCQQTAAGDGGLTITTVVIIVLAVLIVLYAILYFFWTPGSHRFRSREPYIAPQITV